MLSASRPSRDAGVGASSSRRPNTSVSPNTLAVSASVSGVAKWKTPCGRASDGVHAVAELVRERQHVAAARRVVEHHVRRGARDGVGAERAAALARAHRGVDPLLVEERARARGELGREALEGVEHHVLGARPRDRLVLVGHGGHAVVVREPVDAEQPRLEPVPAARQLVAPADRLDQRRDGLVGRLVGEVAAREPVRVGAQPVVDHLLRQQRVEHEAAHAQARAAGRPVTASAVARRSSRSGGEEAR